jgi:pimeloyl-ACP methyl ester carboxylesterase
VSLYWFSGSILSAARIYYENTHRSGAEPAPRGRIAVPTGFARFPAEPWGPSREVMERVANLVRYSEMPAGGHFAAFEQPELWAQDVDAFFVSL